MTTLLLARHGETDWNADGRWQGHSDPPLNDRGRSQALALAETLADEPIAAIYTSTLRRAGETARIVAARLALPVEALDDLREVDVGSWAGHTRAEVERSFPDGYRRWLSFGTGWEDGETYEEMGERIVRALGQIAARHPDELVLVVTHGGPIRGAWAHAAGVPYGEARRLEAVVDNCALSRFAVEAGAFRRLD